LSSWCDLSLQCEFVCQVYGNRKLKNKKIKK
jgi:hypothetical protein